MKKGSPIRLILIIVLGFISGIIFISPLLSFADDEDCSRKNRLICEILFSLGFNYTQIMSGFLGILVLFMLIFIILNLKSENREKIKDFYKSLWDGNNPLGVNTKKFFTHPAQIPMMLGGTWFLIFTIIIASRLLDPFLPRYQDFLLSLLLFPFFFSLGLSGFLMIRRKETVDKFGQIHKGTWAILNGSLLVLFGWGGLLVLILADIFNW